MENFRTIGGRIFATLTCLAVLAAALSVCAGSDLGRMMPRLTAQQQSSPVMSDDPAKDGAGVLAEDDCPRHDSDAVAAGEDCCSACTAWLSAPAPPEPKAPAVSSRPVQYAAVATSVRSLPRNHRPERRASGPPKRAALSYHIRTSRILT